MHRAAVLAVLVPVFLVAALGCSERSYEDLVEDLSLREDTPPVDDLPDVDDDAPADDRTAPDCDPYLVGDEDGPVEAIYTVENGALAGLCFGNPNEAVIGAFTVLETVVGPEGLDDLAYIGGYDGGGETVAFVTPVDASYTSFVMAIDMVAADEYPDELGLTLLHEFAHVFTQTGDQLDIDTGRTACSTLWNGAGCFVPGSYLDSWVNEFWTDEELLSLPADGSADQEGGLERCNVDPGFLGVYAGSSPEEDFAETFSAYVFDLEVPEGVEPRMAFFDAYPEFVAFRDAAVASGLAPVPNPFDRCG